MRTGRAAARSLAVGALVLAVQPLGAQAPVPYADSATAALVQRARARHQAQDSLIHDYRAEVRTRLDVSAGRNRFARLTPLAAHETLARVTWRRPDDLRVEVRGARARSAMRGVAGQVLFERPWFVPRALGDSIRLMGVPETAALHPLARDAERFYEYEIGDSLIVRIPGRTVEAIAVRVRPNRPGPALVTGDLWIDVASGDVVRLRVQFLGEYLWDAPDEDDTPRDSARARRNTRRAQRFLSVRADLEYALHENRYWLPYRQLLDLTIESTFLVRGALPVRALTSFAGYEINTNPELAFVLPEEEADRVRTRCRGCTREENSRETQRERGFVRAGRSGGGRWEIEYPPQDSLEAFRWPDSLELGLTAAERERIRATVVELSRLAEDLPADLVGRRLGGVQWDAVGDLVRYNRVQGPSVGLGYLVRPGPSFTTLDLQARFGIADARPTGRITWRRDAPGGTWAFRAYRTVAEAEPWSRGETLGNSFNALFTGHDDADYHLALGAEVTARGNTGPLADTELALAVERHRSMAAEAGWIGGGVSDVRPNPPVAELDVIRGRVERLIPVGRARLGLGAEGLTGKDLRVDTAQAVTGARGWVSGRIPFRVLERSGALSLRTGYATGDVVPQLAFRVGGPATVRGYPYGFRTAPEMWSAQLDVALTRSWALAPVAFVDAGGTYRAEDPLVGAGLGVSLLGGWMRFNFAKGLRPETDVRFDLLFRAPR